MKHVFAAAVTGLLGVSAAACGNSATDIADFSVVTTLPKEVGPGGFTTTISGDGVASGVFYKMTLADCSAEIEAVGRAWGAQYGLAEADRTVEPGRTMQRYTSDRFPDGAFVITYRLTSGRDNAFVRVTYETTSGKRTLTADELGGIGVVGLVDNLLTAARCEGAS